MFSTFGKVERIRLKVNQKIGPQALYAFVTFQTTSEAQAALERLNGFDMRGRKLRIEFQRSRGDEDRHGDSHYESTGFRERSAPRGERRKRGGGFSDKWNDGYVEDHETNNRLSFKRARYFETERGEYGRGNHGNRTSEFQPSGTSFETQQEQRVSSWPQQQQQRITILLCDLLRQVKPHLFKPSNLPTQSTSPKIQSSLYQQQLMPQQTVTQSSAGVTQHSGGVPNPTILPIQSNQSSSPPSSNWVGFLARNNKRKVPVEIIGIEGSTESFLASVSLNPDFFFYALSSSATLEILMCNSVSVLVFFLFLLFIFPMILGV